MLSFVVPFLGEFSDILWAPIAAYLMKKIHPNKRGNLASIVVFLEELIPFTDLLPTFTLMAFYSLLTKKKPNLVKKQNDVSQ